ncbi:acyl-CoA dehydrogenase family protein [Paraburkholderia sp. J67]|uniref:acyl-CoA dehydrogenase family protein n=1 Tax=Paraburkholderia sp. J67 TaxID=2805435 RepID=UPI002ABDE42A|nr:acyl-CoA dehydrogenase family protein [Paraburkholderia sp. J67]
MDFDFTQEQTLLRHALQSYLQDHYTFEARRRAILSEAGWRREVWKTLGRDLGVLGVALPERVGGFGGGAVETMIVMEELGSVLFIEPFLETCVMAAGALARIGGEVAEDALGRIASGEAVFACGWEEVASGGRLAFIDTRARRNAQGGWRLDGAKQVVMAAPWATQLLVAARTSGARGDAAGLSLFLVDKDAAGVAARDYATIDGRWASDLVFEGVDLSARALLGAEGEALTVLEAVRDTAIAAVCAEAVGVLKRLHGDTLDYTRERKQFGQPIARFQALQHRMVDMYLQVELANSAMYLAALSLDKPVADRQRATSAAKVTISKACRFVGQNAVQLHGAMGMTDELALGHYFKRATVLESAFGGVDHHLARHARVMAAA